jgi:hypothetical protein
MKNSNDVQNTTNVGNEVLTDVSISLLCKDCIRDVRNLRMNDGCIHGVWASPYEQKIFAAKCSEGSCKHDKQ